MHFNGGEGLFPLLGAKAEVNEMLWNVIMSVIVNKAYGYRVHKAISGLDQW